MVVRRPADDTHEGPAHEAQRTGIERYGPLVADQIELYQRYTLVLVGDAQYAYTTHGRCVHALREAWRAGLVPTLGRSGVRGVELSDLAPRLRGVDSDLSDLRRSETEPHGGRLPSSS